MPFVEERHGLRFGLRELALRGLDLSDALGRLGDD
jgi:hypothetical protein